MATGIAFWALAELLRAAAGAPRDAGAEQVRTALASRLERVGVARAEETATTLAGTLDGADSESDTAAIRRSWRQLIAGLADERPVLIAVDDLHWADEGFLDLIEDAVRLPAQPVLIVCTARPEIDERRPALTGDESRDRIDLGPLSPAAAEELAAALSRVPTSPSPTRSRKPVAATRSSPRRSPARSPVPAPISTSACRTRSRQPSPRVATHCRLGRDRRSGTPPSSATGFARRRSPSCWARIRETRCRSSKAGP